MKKLRRSLIVGKFSPLHQGHERLIRWSYEQSDEVIIFSYSNPELAGCDPDKRLKWLKTLFPDLEIFIFTSANSSFPQNSEPDIVHRQFVASMYIQKVGKPLDAIFAGEEYVVDFAKFMSDAIIKVGIQTQQVQAIMLDRHENNSQVSATLVRTDIHKNKNLVHPIVYADFVQSVCFLGSESTGKSTLTALLSKTFQTNSVTEYGRTLWEQKKGNLIFSDLLDIAKIHIQNEAQARLSANRYVFIDTTPLTTFFYSHAYFQKADSQLEDLTKRHYDHVFLCMPDFPMVQDGTRADENFRQKQHDWYLHELATRNIKYKPLFGSVSERVQTVITELTERTHHE